MKNPYNIALSAPSLVSRPLSSLHVPLGMRLATLLLSMVLQVLSLHYGYKYSYHENMLACYCFSSLSTCICSGCGFFVCLPTNGLLYLVLHSVVAEMFEGQLDVVEWFWYTVRLVAQNISSTSFCVTRDTHCADFAPRTSTFPVCLVLPKLRFLRSQSMCPGNQTSLKM